MSASAGVGTNVYGTVAAGWEPVREEFEAFVAAEAHSPRRSWRCTGTAAAWSTCGPARTPVPTP